MFWMTEPEVSDMDFSMLESMDWNCDFFVHGHLKLHLVHCGQVAEGILGIVIDVLE
jgi:hypothetical protein